MSNQNPYAPPTAKVVDAVAAVGGEERLIPGGRVCPAGNGARWFGEAWRIFKVQPFLWWLALMMSFGVFMVMSLIPLVNIVASLAFPIITAGIGACARSVLRDGQFQVGQVFEGFNRRPGALVLLGLLYFLSIIAVTAILMGIFWAVGMTGMPFGSDAEEAFSGFQPAVIVTFLFALAAVVSTAIFSPYLIHEHNVPVQQAMLMSARACFTNVGASLVALLMFIVLAIAACIPLFLGWLVLWPVLMLTVYTAYRDIFIETTAAD